MWTPYVTHGIQIQTVAALDSSGCNSQSLHAQVTSEHEELACPIALHIEVTQNILCRRRQTASKNGWLHDLRFRRNLILMINLETFANVHWCNFCPHTFARPSNDRINRRPLFWEGPRSHKSEMTNSWRTNVFLNKKLKLAKVLKYCLFTVSTGCTIRPHESHDLHERAPKLGNWHSESNRNNKSRYHKTR